MKQETKDKIFYVVLVITGVTGACAGYMDGRIKGALLGLVAYLFFGLIVSVFFASGAYLRFFQSRESDRTAVLFSPIGAGIGMTICVALGAHFGVFITPARWYGMIALAGVFSVLAVLVLRWRMR